MHRTTVRLDKHLLFEVKTYAGRRGLSLTGVIEEALRSLLARVSSPAQKKARRLKLPTFKGRGFQPGIKTWNDVKRVLEDEESGDLKRVMRENAASRR